VARFAAAAAAGEADRSDGLAPEGVKDRAATLLSRNRSASGPGSATALFVGLFGTVCGDHGYFYRHVEDQHDQISRWWRPASPKLCWRRPIGLIAAIPAAAPSSAMRRRRFFATFPRDLDRAAVQRVKADYLTEMVVVVFDPA